MNVPFTFPDFVNPAGKRMAKKEKIQLNVNAVNGGEIMCKTTSHPTKVHIWLFNFFVGLQLKFQV